MQIIIENSSKIFKTIAIPLKRLPKKNVKFSFNKDCQTALQKQTRCKAQEERLIRQEKNDSTIEKELFALVLATKPFRPYLLGQDLEYFRNITRTFKSTKPQRPR